jgi:hypothetical protein
MTGTAKTRSSRRSRRIVLVAACAQRKRIPVLPDLSLASLSARPEERLHEWRERLASTPAPRLTAESMYAGDHWSAVLEAYRLSSTYSSRTELWIISAGYGLIESSSQIKPYSATFSSGKPDSVWRGPIDGGRIEQLQAWWRGLNQRTTLEDVMPSGDGAMLIAAGADYLTAIRTEVERLAHTGDEHLSVISAGSHSKRASLPVTGGLRTALGGTDSALNARVLRLIAATAHEHEFRYSRMERLLNHLAHSTRPPPRQRGNAATDAALQDFIRSLRRRVPGISRTRALRDLRASGIACEQNRFAAIWARS